MYSSNTRSVMESTNETLTLTNKNSLFSRQQRQESSFPFQPINNCTYTAYTLFFMLFGPVQSQGFLSFSACAYHYLTRMPYSLVRSHHMMVGQLMWYCVMTRMSATSIRSVSSFLIKLFFFVVSLSSRFIEWR